jgi:hypothetical protein
MLSTTFSSSGLVGGWMAALAMLVAASVALGANVSTTALMLALGVAPGIVIALLSAGAASPRVAVIGHAVQRRAGRS